MNQEEDVLDLATNLNEEELMKQTMEAFNEAKLHMLTKGNSAFISSLLHNFKLQLNPQIQSVAHNLNEQTISINPEWFIESSPEIRATALAEQVYHAAFLHEWRMGKRDPELYQKACDQVVRHMLKKTGFELPPNYELDSEFKDASVEYTYNEMEKEWNNNGKDNSSPNSNFGNSNGNGNDPFGNDLNLNGEAPSSQAVQQMQQNLNSAAMAEEMTSGKAVGDSGADFEQAFKKLNEGKLAWNVILQSYLNERTQGEISYERFDRRLLPLDLYLPTNISQAKVNKVAVAFDVSGSVSQEQIKAFLREMRSIKSQLNPKTMDVVTFNHNIVDIFTFTENETLEDVTMRIGGGTDLVPVFNHYLKPKERPEFLIVFSDLWCSAIQEKTPFDTIWICIDNPDAQVNFGKLIHINTEDLVNG